MGGFKVTFEQFIEYRNKIVIRLRARKKHFKSNKPNYYEIRLEQIDSQYPEFKKLGVINLKVKE